MRLIMRCASLLVVSALSLGAGPALAETQNCTPITTVPVLIVAQGIYCLNGNLNTGISSGNAIEIAANDVVIDFNGWKLGGLGAGPGTTASGIRADNRRNITIKNGTIRGFMRGIELNDSGNSEGHVIESMRADQNTYIGVVVQGRGNLLRNNQVVKTGGSTSPTVVTGGNANAYGIVVLGDGPRVLNNDVITTFKQGIGTAWEIFITSGTGALAVNNRLTDATVGVDYSVSTGKYRDNLTVGITTPYTGGTDAGNNN